MPSGGFFCVTPVLGRAPRESPGCRAKNLVLAEPKPRPNCNCRCNGRTGGDNGGKPRGNAKRRKIDDEVSGGSVNATGLIVADLTSRLGAWRRPIASWPCPTCLRHFACKPRRPFLELCANLCDASPGQAQCVLNWPEQSRQDDKALSFTQKVNQATVEGFHWGPQAKPLIVEYESL